MSLVWMEGFDFCSFAQINGRRWASAQGNQSGMTTGRFGGQALRIAKNNASPSDATSKVFASVATFFLGFAFRHSSIASAPVVIQLLDSGTTQLELRCRSTGVLYVTRNGTQVGSDTTSALVANTWYYLEFGGVIADSGGSWEVRVDGVTVGTGAGLDTKNTANASFNQLYLPQGLASSITADWDDMYLCDDAGSVNNGFLGDCRVETLYPSGAGATTQMSPSTGSNFQNVDESAASNDDTDYNADATVGHKDTYALGNLATSIGAIKGLQVNMTARKDFAGNRQVCHVVRPASTDYDGANQQLTLSYAILSGIRETDPGTSSAWTVAGVNAMEAGVKLTV